MAVLCGSAVRESCPADNATFYLYVGGLSWPRLEYHAGELASGHTGFAGVFPTHDGEACVWVGCPAPMVAGVSGGAVEAFFGLLGSVSPSLAARARAGRVTSRVR